MVMENGSNLGLVYPSIMKAPDSNTVALTAWGGCCSCSRMVPSPHEDPSASLHPSMKIKTPHHVPSCRQRAWTLSATFTLCGKHDAPVDICRMS